MQFIDIGSGLPTASNTHDVAQRLGPAARVAYVDIDDIAVRQAREIIAAQRRWESVGVIVASALEPETIDRSREAGGYRDDSTNAFLLAGVV